MKQPDNWFTSTNILQMIYILVTLIFSCLIWRATQKGAEATKAASDASNASLDLAKTLQEKQDQVEEQLKQAYRMDVYAKTLIVFESAKALKKGISVDEVRKVPEKFDVGTVEAAKYFSSYEQGLITTGKANIELIRKNYFKNGEPSFKIDQDMEERINKMYEIFGTLVCELEKSSSSTKEIK